MTDIPNGMFIAVAISFAAVTAFIGVRYGFERHWG